MHSGFRVGQVFGITIRIDWSWLFIFFLITWNLASAFSDYHSNWSSGLVLGMAVVAALLFFGSVLAHELAHSLVARRRGVPVRNITLFLFGGVSNIERDPDSPKSEFLITIVGPLTSLILGGLLLLLADAVAHPVSDTLSNSSQALRQLSPGATLLMWLGTINVVVGIFNLIPGFPLDGGRILRSILWAATNNLHRATRWASWAGQAVAWLLILTGVAMIFGAQVPFFGTGLVGGLWLAFIGWFLNNAAIQTYQRLVIQDILENVPVARMMRTDPPTVDKGVSVDALVHSYVMRVDDHAFPVLENDNLIGLVTLEDIRKVPREQWATTTVQQIMTPLSKLVVVTSDEDAGDAWEKLAQGDLRQLPVLQGQHLAGLLRRSDIVRWLQLQSKLSPTG